MRREWADVEFIVEVGLEETRLEALSDMREAEGDRVAGERCPRCPVTISMPRCPDALPHARDEMHGPADGERLEIVDVADVADLWRDVYRCRPLERLIRAAPADFHSSPVSVAPST